MSGFLKRSGDDKKPDTKSKTPAKRTPQIRVAKNVYRKQIFRRLAKAFTYTFLGLLGVYLCFAATIIRVIPSYGDLPPTPVKNITYPGGLIPPGAQVVVNLKEAQGNGGLDHLKQALLPTKDAVLVEVVGGPHGRIAWAESGLVTLDGAPVNVTLKEKPASEFLTKQYLVKCIDGPCVKGEGFIISASNIYGQPL